MPPKALDTDTLLAAVAAVAQHGGLNQASLALKMPRSTLQSRINSAMRQGLCAIEQEPGQAWTVSGMNAARLDVPELPDELPTADELLERRKKQYDRKSGAHAARSLIRITVKDDGPIGIMHMGDPHVDDDGTDLGLLESHVRLVNATDGMYAGNVGDYSNNWVGRLARLYAEQSLSAKEAWVLVEWLITSTRWLYLVGGNHDLWSGASDPISWITKQAGQRYDQWGARLGLVFPNGREVRINARHDFQGHSQWNTSHGVAKAVQMGWRDHILTCGHLHVSGYQVLKDPSSGLISHAIRCASYKALDRYAMEKGLPNQAIFVAPVTIIDPRYTDDDPRLVTFFTTPEIAADYLTFIRKRKAS